MRVCRLLGVWVPYPHANGRCMWPGAVCTHKAIIATLYEFPCCMSFSLSMWEISTFEIRAVTCGCDLSCDADRYKSHKKKRTL